MPRSCKSVQTRRLVLNCRSNRLRPGRPGGALCGGLAHGGAARGRRGRAGPGHVPHDRAQHQQRGAAVLRHTLVRARSGLHGRKHAKLSRTSCPVLSQSWRVPHQLLNCFLLAARGLSQPCSRTVHLCGNLVACAGHTAEVMGCPELISHYARQTQDMRATSTVGNDSMAQVMGCGVHVPEALRCADMYRNAAGNQLEMRGTLRYRTGAERHACPLATCGPWVAVYPCQSTSPCDKSCRATAKYFALFIHASVNASIVLLHTHTLPGWKDRRRRRGIQHLTQRCASRDCSKLCYKLQTRGRAGSFLSPQSFFSGMTSFRVPSFVMTRISTASPCRSHHAHSRLRCNP